MPRRSEVLTALALAGLFAGGCTSLLGDFATTRGGDAALTEAGRPGADAGGKPDGKADGTVADASSLDGSHVDATLSDAPPDGPADSGGPPACGASAPCDGGCIAEQPDGAATDFDQVIDLSIADGRAYWISSHGYVRWVSLDGGAPQAIDIPNLLATSIAAFDGEVFVVGTVGSAAEIFSVNPTTLNSTSGVPLLGVAASGHNLVADSTYVYVATGPSNMASGRVARFTRDLQTTIPLGAVYGTPVGVALDTANIYWAESSLGHVMASTITGGSPPVQIASFADAGGSPPYVAGLALDGLSLYWSQRVGVPGVYTYPTTAIGTGQPTLVSGPTNGLGAGALAIAHDATGLYFGINFPSPMLVHLTAAGGLVTYATRSAPTTVGLSGCQAYWASTYFGGDDAGQNGDILYAEPEN
jgi:hypothetical protein